ncbi:MAG: hypothetical protein JNJ54_04640 [Myxococcaceae bacterium]|nr:hypothetical protein [Myxococcaceae bacterium]
MSDHSDIALLGGRLRARGVRRLGEVDLDGFKDGDRRLMLVVDADEVFDDPICHYIFTKALGRRGDMALVAPTEPELVAQLPHHVRLAVGWLSAGLEVTLAVVEPVPLLVATAAVLVGTGLRAPAAVDVVWAAADAVPSADEEIAVSVFEEHLRNRHEGCS